MGLGPEGSPKKDEIRGMSGRPSRGRGARARVRGGPRWRKLRQEYGRLNEVQGALTSVWHQRVRPSNLLTLYSAQIRPSLEYCSPTALSILDAVQRRAIRLIGDLA
nr:unnamed protein product [Callosobruchus chinensis]